MPLELRIEKDGRVRRVRPFWYGRFEINGQRQCLNLGVKVKGTPPPSLSLKDEGDMDFERSRVAARIKLEGVIEEARTKQGSVRLVEKLYEIKTGEVIKTVLLENLHQEWAKIPRKRKLDERYSSQCQSTLKRFAEFVHHENVKATEVAHVTRQIGHSFLDAESKRGVTAKTWNETLKLLRTTFKHLLPIGAINPFSNVPTRETETIFRKPYSPEELAAILEAARTDEFIRPILITGICSAMRRGDCCLLEWTKLDLENRFISVKTAKTGQMVSIPIFPLLYDELVLRAKKRQPNEKYVFPEQAAMYQENPDGITWRVQKVLAAAGFRDDELETANENAIEQESDKPISPSNKSAGTSAFRGEIHMERKEGLRRASVRDFHSFRVTWVTLALTAGVPLELVQKVTGHKTTDVVLKHYFQPGREAFRQALQVAMPKLLTNGQKSPKEQIKIILAQDEGENLDKRQSTNRRTVENIVKSKGGVMALIPCRECNETVSIEAVACTHCGAPQQQPVPPPIPHQIKEETIYSDNTVVVTNLRVIIGGATYPLRSLTSVKMLFTPPRLVKPILLLIVGLMILFAALMPFNEKAPAPPGVYIIAVAMIGGAILWKYNSKTMYHMALASASGEIHAITSPNKTYIQHIILSVNQAMVKCS